MLIQSPEGIWIREENQAQDQLIIDDIIKNDSYKLQTILDVVKNAKLIVDVGAHIGCFAILANSINPKATIVCIEACPENVDILRKNVGEFATVIHAACSYEEGELMLLNSVREDCESTGGSVVIKKIDKESTELRQQGYQYWDDERELLNITLEEVLLYYSHNKIDILKLDCEGSELSILGNTTSLDKIEYIIGEYHQREKWNHLRESRLSSWWYNEYYTHESGLGLFHMSTSRSFSDISEYYQEDLALKEEQAWTETKEYLRNFDQLSTILQDCKTIIEIGCGSGWIPTLLPAEIEYIGIDKNAHFLEMCRHKNQGKNRIFKQADIRSINTNTVFDISCSWAFLKHFSLEEFDTILTNILRLGKKAIFEVQITKNWEYNDGIHFHHTFVSEDRLQNVITKSGYREINRIQTFESHNFKVFTVITERL